ncbi:hypothetical protein ACT3TQ_01180 [Halomonas sp. AOP12-C2-37]|uniref:hypothetical protein n=1 Tax=unclassified Halomonas TaxID=2609666 RepID=UPI004034641B
MDVDFFSEASDVLLEVEVNKSHAAQFEDQYLATTGEHPSLGSGYQHQNNKWGGEYRIYFNADFNIIGALSDIGVHVEQGGRPYRSSRRCRVNNKEFFWALVALGYRLGES